MADDRVSPEKFAKATIPRSAVEQEAQLLRDLGATDVVISEDATFWYLSFTLPAVQ